MDTNRSIKKYIIWVYFLVYPLTNGYIPDVNLGLLDMNPFRLYLCIPILYLFHLFYINHGRIKVSREATFLLLFYLFAIFNNWRTENFKATNVINYLFPLLFIIAIENLEYEKEDFARFFRMISILAVIILIVTLIQKYVDYSFFSGFKRQQWIELYSFGGDYHRFASIYRTIDFYQGGVAIGMLCVIFMYLNFDKIRLKYLVLCFMMMISTFFTYTRSNWIIPLIAFLLFIHFKPWRKKIGLIIAVLVASLFFYSYFLPRIQETELYSDRVTKDTYEGRFVSIDIYFKYFWGRNMLMGFGEDSSESEEFRAYGRPEVHNGYLEILFQHGFIGFFLYFAFWFYLFKRARVVYKYTGNGIFIVFIVYFIASNFIFKFINMSHIGYHMMILYMHMYFQVYVKTPLAGGAY